VYNKVYFITRKKRFAAHFIAKEKLTMHECTGTKSSYIKMISARGRAKPNGDGVLDLLNWCNKPNTACVTLEEAKQFWEDPDSPPPAMAASENDDQK